MTNHVYKPDLSPIAHGFTNSMAMIFHPLVGINLSYLVWGACGLVALVLLFFWWNFLR